MTRYLLLFDSYGLVLWGALSDERMGLSFVYAAGPCQRSLSQVLVEARAHFVSPQRHYDFLVQSYARVSIWGNQISLCNQSRDEASNLKVRGFDNQLSG
jgi:hypothetical protein